MGQAQFYIAGMTDLSGVIGSGPGVTGTDTLFNYFKKIADYVDTLETDTGLIKGYTDSLEGSIGGSGDNRASNTVMGWLNTVIKSIQYGTVSLGTTQTSNTADITSVTASKSLLIPLGVSAASKNDGTVASSSHYCVRLSLQSTTVTATRVASEGTAATAGFCVVEFY